MKYTLQILNRAGQNLPPLTPRQVKETIAQLLVSAEGDANSVFELENILISISKEVWPYRQAYMNFLENNHKRLADNLFLRYVSGPARNSVKNYFAGVGTFDDLHQGTHMHQFDVAVRPEILDALMQTKKEIDSYTRQEVVGVKRKAYETEVDKYFFLLEEVEKKLVQLDDLSKKEDYSNLSSEILGYIYATNQGFAGLGPYVGLEELENFIEQIPGRRKIKQVYLSAHV